jgi:hypothetical protein
MYTFAPVHRFTAPMRPPSHTPAVRYTQTIPNFSTRDRCPGAAARPPPWVPHLRDAGPRTLPGLRGQRAGIMLAGMTVGQVMMWHR